MCFNIIQTSLREDADLFLFFYARENNIQIRSEVDMFILELESLMKTRKRNIYITNAKVGKSMN